jgi:biopolymer transport protein ExbD
MFGSRKRNQEAGIDVELPITPMLDMSFQLMAFFILTFRPLPQEGQLAMYLPKDEAAEQSQVLPNIPDEDRQDEYKITVTSAQGAIATLSLHGPTSVVSIPGEGDTKMIGLEEALKRIAKPFGAGKKGPTARIEADNTLQYAQLIQVMDACRRAGFDSVGVGPINPGGEAPK